MPPVPEASASPSAISITVENGENGPLSTVYINGNTPSMFETGTLLIMPAEPQADSLARLQSEFGGTPGDALGGLIYGVAFDLSLVDLSDLETSIKELNKINQMPIQSARFTSEHAAKTFKLAADLMTKHRDLVVYAGFNWYQPLP